MQFWGTPEAPVHELSLKWFTTHPRFHWVPKYIIIIMLQSKSIHKCASMCINPRMKLLAHILIGMVTAEYMKNGRHTLWCQLLPVGMVDVLEIMVLVLVGEPFEVSEDLLLELGVVLDQLWVNVLQTHPLVVAEGVDVQRRMLGHLDADDWPIGIDLDLVLPCLNSSAGQHEAVVCLHESLPFVFKRFVRPIQEF